MVHDDAAVGLDALQVEFDDERAVCDAGVTLVATLARRCQRSREFPSCDHENSPRLGRMVEAGS
jgi:hypothetical protein